MSRVAEMEADVRIGRAIARRRKLAGLNQSELARLVGVSFQQIQKYECASNRIAASRLLTIANALGAPVAELYGDTIQ